MKEPLEQEVGGVESFATQLFEKTGARYPYAVAVIISLLCGVCTLIAFSYLMVLQPADLPLSALRVPLLVGFALAALYFSSAVALSTRQLRLCLACQHVGPCEHVAVIERAWNEAGHFGDRLVLHVFIAGVIATGTATLIAVFGESAVPFGTLSQGYPAAAMLSGLEVVVILPFGRALMLPVLRKLKSKRSELVLHDHAGVRSMRRYLLMGFLFTNVVVIVLNTTVAYEISRHPDQLRLTELVTLNVLALLILLFTLWAYLRLILNPLERLIAGVGTIDAAETSWRAGTLGVGEVGLLGEAFDHMLCRLDESNKELLSQERLLLRNQRLETLGTLAAGVAHEINNPLTAIQANLEFLEDDSLPRDEMLEAIGDSIESAQQIQTIVRGLTLHARGDDGEVPTRLDAATVMQESLRMVRTQIPDDLKLTIDLSETMHLIVRHSRLRQVLMNLLVNAFHALESIEAAELSLRLLRRDNAVCFRIEDNGPGIPVAVQKKIFDPFFSTKDIGKGTGLGLHISRTIIDAAGGRIELASEPGKTVFEVWLPSVDRQDG